MKTNDSNIYVFQQRAMPVLLGWSLGSIVSGLLWWRSASAWWRGLGSQFIGWGLIDGLIAAFALRGAKQKAAQLEAGQITLDEHDQQAQQFERFVALNILLDTGYMLAGGWLARRKQDEDAQQSGMGWGILLQGAFLFIWDILLVVFARRTRHG